MIEIQRFISKFKQYPLLKPKEERAMLTLIRTPPEGVPEDAVDWVPSSEQAQAREEFICRNIRLVIHTTKKFCSLDDPRVLDFISAGIQGMIHSVDTFDLSREVRFSTYANWWIQAEIRKQIKVMDTKIIRFKTLFLNYKKLRNSYLAEGKFKLDEDLFTELGWDEETRNKFREDQARLKISLDTLDTSINDFVSEDDAILIDPPQEEVLEDLHKEEQLELLGKALEILTPEQKTILLAHFGVGGVEKTYDDLSREMGITREKVRQIENKALSKLWRYMKTQAPSLCD